MIDMFYFHIVVIYDPNLGKNYERDKYEGDPPPHILPFLYSVGVFPVRRLKNLPKTD